MTYAHDADIFVMPPHIAGHPDVAAMIGAFFSRSYRPMRERVADLGLDMDVVREKLGTYVTGYGHESILDMCNVAVAIENVPILAAVSIEDTPLFAGQESSTRYMDWSTERFLNPLPSDHAAHAHIERAFDLLRRTYVRVQQGALHRIAEANGDTALFANSGLSKEESTRMAAMRARSFDIARGWLPCAAITRVCWSGRLSAMRAHLRDLHAHPDANVHTIAERTWAALHAQYPQAMGSSTVDRTMDQGYAGDRWTPSVGGSLVPFFDAPLVEHFTNEATHEALARRKWCEAVPQQPFVGAPQVSLQGMLDYGSLRDLHRHRRGVHAFAPPELSDGFHAWYCEMSDAFVDTNDLLRELESIVDCIDQECADMGDDARRHVVAHALPLATVCPVEYDMDVPQMAYLVDRRTTMDVHPTLRRMILDALDDTSAQEDLAPLALHPTRTPDPGKTGYVLRRGSQTITVGGVDIAEAERNVA